MPRPKRADEASAIYHALNRGNARATIFQKDADYDAFENILAEGLQRYPCRILAYQRMPNHWHFVLQPTEDGGMGNFLRWVSLTHTMRYHAHDHTAGEGHVYQGRFKSFSVEDDDHYFVQGRYVERNAFDEAVRLEPKREWSQSRVVCRWNPRYARGADQPEPTRSREKSPDTWYVLFFIQAEASRELQLVLDPDFFLTRSQVALFFPRGKSGPAGVARRSAASSLQTTVLCPILVPSTSNSPGSSAFVQPKSVSGLVYLRHYAKSGRASGKPSPSLVKPGETSWTKIAIRVATQS